MVHCQCLLCSEWGRREEIPICIAGIHNTEPWLLIVLMLPIVDNIAFNCLYIT